MDHRPLEMGKILIRAFGRWKSRPSDRQPSGAMVGEILRQALFAQIPLGNPAIGAG
jgi:hypothetical protein